MSPISFFSLRALAFSILLSGIWSCAPDTQPLTEKEAQKLGIEAYVYGYPLITMEMTRRVMTNTEAPTQKRAPMGQFANMRQYPSSQFKEVTSPNADTLYSIAWVNLAKEPYVLHIPAEGDRYYLMPILNAWTDVIETPGSRTNKNVEEDFVITGPDWKGTLPEGVTEIKSSTNLIWIIGRTYTSGTLDDYKLVHAIQDQYRLIPLSYYGKPYTPPKGHVDPSIDMKTPVRDQVNRLDAQTYFNMLALLMKENPPYADDKKMLKKLEKLGIVPGKTFEIDKVEENIATGLKSAVKIGPKIIPSSYEQSSVIENDWLMFKEVGRYGNNYLDRAFITYVGLGANLPQDAIYPVTRKDSQGETLNGKNKYVIHFDKGKMPPVKGFWSLTLYDEHLFFVPNILERYSINARDTLKTNSDGSVDLYIQQDSPGADKESNWLPAPAGEFVLMFRFYWPERAIVSGRWEPPGVEKVN